MRYLLILILFLATSVPLGTSPGGAFAQQAATAKVELARPVRLGFAGVKIALPNGFKLQMTEDPLAVVRAVKFKNDQPVMAIMLSAWPQSAETALASFIEVAGPKSLAVRSVKLLKTKPLRVAGLDGQIRLLSYTFRGVETTAVRLFFLRAVPAANMQMGYALTIEGDKKHTRQVLPALGAVIGTIELFDPVRPVSEKIVLADEPVVSRKYGYSIRPPVLWKTVARGWRVVMFQTDYLRGGQQMPTALLTVAEAADAPAKQCAEEALANLSKAVKARKGDLKILRQGPVRMAGQDGYEFLTRETIASEDKQAPRAARPEARIMVIAQRTVCAGGRSYSLVLLYQTDKVESVSAAMETIASGLQLLGPPTSSQPATSKTEK